MTKPRPKALLLRLLLLLLGGRFVLVGGLTRLDRRMALRHGEWLLFGSTTASTSLLLLHDRNCAVNDRRVRAETTLSLQEAQNDNASSDAFIPPSQNFLGEEHRKMIRRWRRNEPPTLLDATRAARDLVSIRWRVEHLGVILLRSDTSEVISSSQWAEIEETLSMSGLAGQSRASGEGTGGDESGTYPSPSAIGGGLADFLTLQAAALTRCTALPLAVRQDIGWGWGLCGGRHNCGPHADASKALSTLASQGRMLTAAEALFLVDVSKRGLDELLTTCQRAGLLPQATAQRQERQKQPDAEGYAPMCSSCQETQLLLRSGLAYKSTRSVTQGGAALPPPAPVYLDKAVLDRVLLGGGERGGRATAAAAAAAAEPAVPLSGLDAAIEAYEAEILAAFAQEREASKVADGGGADQSTDVSEMPPQMVSEVPTEPGAVVSITKAQRDLALQLRLGF